MVTLKKQRDGQTWRPFWYGRFEADGKCTVMNLNIRWRGTPPLSLREPGDKDFERSREQAEEALARHVEEARQKGRVEHLTERLIESKSGRTVEYVRIDELPDRWRKLGRDKPASEAHLVNCDAHFRRFIQFMQERNAAAMHLYEVTPENAGAFVDYLRAKLSPATAQYGVRLIAKALTRFLPVGAANPFSEFLGRRGNGDSGVIHRKPFSPDELRRLLDVASGDSFMYPLIVTAACSGMRRADVCNLKWSAVDLAGGMLTVKTSKTDTVVEIPIFARLREVLAEREGTGRGFVFPEAAAMLRDNGDGLSRRFKILVARTFDTQPPEPPAEPIPAAEIEAEGIAAIHQHASDEKRRARLLEIFRRYCAGESVRFIRKETKLSKGTISYDLNVIAKWIDKPFMRSARGENVNAAIDRVTRSQRTHGNAASLYDWHSLRTTWVTLALSAGVPMELVRRVTGHKTVEVVLQNYFRPDREQFKAALIGALPDVLTGNLTKQKPADELAALAAKLAAGTATAEEKKRLRLLAAKV